MPSIDDIINRQFRRWEMEKVEWVESGPMPEPPAEIVTVSREVGSRGAYFAELLAGALKYQLIHKEVIDAICRSTGYRKRIIESLDERHRSRLEVLVQAFVTGQAVDHTDYIRYLYEVVQSMSRLGGVVLVGRGGNFILGPRRGFHIRFVCPREERILNLMTYRSLGRREAVDTVEHSDAERRAFVRKLFKADIDDPHHYDLVVNSAYVDLEEMVAPTIQAIHRKLRRLSQPEEQGR
jgi:cytidylate kinase